jgi:hypothetical protein
MDYRVGDIFGQPSKGILYWLSNLFTTPRNECIHHGILEHYDDEHDEWWVLESTSSKGVCRNPVGNREIKVYRVNNVSDEQRKEAVRLTANYIGAFYDWKLGFQLLWHGLPRLLMKRGKLTAKELSEGWYKHDKFYICTEAATYGYYSQGIGIIPSDVCPLPCSIKEAELEGKIKEVNYARI